MKRVLLFGTILICFSLSSCQCADKPDVGPVEDEGQAHLQEAPSQMGGSASRLA